MKYTASYQVSIGTSVGNVSYSYDEALVESVIGLFRPEVINLLGPWKSADQIEWQTLRWVHWFNTKRLHGAIGCIIYNQVEQLFYAHLNTTNKAV